jgi:outer membrane protein
MQLRWIAKNRLISRLAEVSNLIEELLVNSYHVVVLKEKLFLRRIILKQYAMSSLLRLLIASGAMLVIFGAAAQEAKIGYVSTERIMRESEPAKAAEARMENEFSQRRKDLQDFAAKIKTMAEKLDKDSPTLNESDRLKRQRELADMDQDFQRKQRAYREDIGQRMNEETAKLNERTTKIIKQIAESEKYDAILQDGVYFSPRIDITEKVMKALNK